MQLVCLVARLWMPLGEGFLVDLARQPFIGLQLFSVLLAWNDLNLKTDEGLKKCIELMQNVGPKLIFLSSTYNYNFNRC